MAALRKLLLEGGDGRAGPRGRRRRRVDLDVRNLL